MYLIVLRDKSTLYIERQSYMACLSAYHLVEGEDDGLQSCLAK